MQVVGVVPVVLVVVLLSCPLVVPVVAGSQGARKGHFLPSLGSLESLKEPGPQEGPNRAKERETG